MMHAPIRRHPERIRDWTLDECHARATITAPSQPSNALYSRTPEEMTNALFLIAGKRVTKLGEVA